MVCVKNNENRKIGNFFSILQRSAGGLAINSSRQESKVSKTAHCYCEILTVFWMVQYFFAEVFLGIVCYFGACNSSRIAVAQCFA